MNRKEFLITLVGLPIAGVVPLNTPQPTNPSYTVVNGDKSLTPPIDWISGWRSLTDGIRENDVEYRGAILGYHDVLFPYLVMMDIFNQLKAMVGDRVVYFIPCVEDHDKFRELGGDRWVPLVELEKRSPDENNKIWQDSCKIGNLIEVRNNNGIEARVDIDPKFEVFPFRSYTLNIGIDSNHVKFEPYGDANEMLMSRKPFVVESCKIKGLYFDAVKNPNHVDWHTGLRTYYQARMLNMFIYLPGRCYW